MKQYKFIIAPDSFKESVDAFDASTAIKEGMSPIFPDAVFELIPMADGGEGTSKVITFAQNGNFINIDVKGPLGDITTASYGYIESTKTAILECAEGCGLHLVPPDKKNPLLASTYGVGEIICHAIENKAEHIIIGLGGSATNDGGLGMLTALGGKFFDENHNEVEPYALSLSKIKSIDLKEVTKKLKNVTIDVACDVENPLLGPEGATYTFGRQKGADDNALKILEEGMKNYAKVINEEFGIEIGSMPKAGAAGGLGGAFLLLGCTMKKGIDLVLENTNFDERAKNADFIITGEGSIDSQTKYGKTISGIAQIAVKHNIPLIALGGRVGDDINELYDIGVTSVFGIVDSAKSLDKALADGYSSIRKTSENIARLIKYCK